MYKEIAHLKGPVTTYYSYEEKYIFVDGEDLHDFLEDKFDLGSDEGIVDTKDLILEVKLFRKVKK